MMALRNGESRHASEPADPVSSESVEEHKGDRSLFPVRCGSELLNLASFIRMKQLEMVFSAFDDSVLLHPGQFFGHVCALKVQIIGQLLAVKGNVKRIGVLLK